MWRIEGIVHWNDYKDIDFDLIIERFIWSIPKEIDPKGTKANDCLRKIILR